MPTALIVVIAIGLAALVAALRRRHPSEAWPGADAPQREREALGRASTRAMYALTEAAQYVPWHQGTNVVSIEDFLPPPSGMGLVLVGLSENRCQHAIRRAGLNPANVKIVRYAWQVPQPALESGPGLRVAVLADAYQLEHWDDLRALFARYPGAQFLLLQT